MVKPRLSCGVVIVNIVEAHTALKEQGPPQRLEQNMMQARADRTLSPGKDWLT